MSSIHDLLHAKLMAIADG